MRKIPYPRPGETLQHEFLEPMGITAYRLAKDIGVSHRNNNIERALCPTDQIAETITSRK